MRAIAFYVAKGGVGKSTGAANLGAALAGRGRRVLLLDLDPQASATRLLGRPPGEGLLGAILAGEGLEELVEATPHERLELVRGGPELVGAEEALAREAGGDRLLALALEALDPTRWDYALLDGAPGANRLAVSALAASTDHVVPVSPDPLSIAGLASALEISERVAKRLNAKLAPAKILISRKPRTRAARIASEGLRERFGARVFAAEIPERAICVEALARRLPVVIHAPESAPSIAYLELAEEIDS